MVRCVFPVLFVSVCCGVGSGLDSCRAQVAQVPPAGPVIPAVRSTTFAGQAVSLPEALTARGPDGVHGHPAILIVGWTRDSRTAATDWGHRLEDDAHLPKAVLFYELPMMVAVPRLLRPLVLRQIRASVSERGQSHFLPVDDQEKQWRAVATPAVQDNPVILLVDPAGHIRWKTEGPPTDAAMHTLEAFSQSLLNP